MATLPVGCVAPLGDPHGIVLSLPTLADLVDYETGVERVTCAVTHGYPRFVAHALVRRLMEQLSERLGLCDTDQFICAVVSERAATKLATFVSSTCDCRTSDITGASDSAHNARILSGIDLARRILRNSATCDLAESALARMSVVIIARCKHSCSDAKAFMQHTGVQISSRHADDALTEMDADLHSCSEVPCALVQTRDASDAVVEQLSGTLSSLLQVSRADTFVTNCGAAAVAFAHASVSRMWHSAVGGGASACCDVQLDTPTSEQRNQCASVQQQAAGEEQLYVTTQHRNACAPSSAGSTIPARSVWVQLGWLYVDTTELLRKLSGDGRPQRLGQSCACTASGETATICSSTCSCVLGTLRAVVASCGDGARATVLSATAVALYDVEDMAAISALLSALGAAVAGVVTECPTNPLVRTPAVQSLYSITRSANVPLVVDGTIAPPGTLKGVPQLCDLYVASTTKYSGNAANVLGGLIAVNGCSPWADAFRDALSSSPPDPPYARDAKALVDQMRRMPLLLPLVNATTVAVVRWLQSLVAPCDAPRAVTATEWRTAPLSAVHWAYSGDDGEPVCAAAGQSGARYRELAGCSHEDEAVPGCMVTFELRGTGRGRNAAGDDDAEDEAHAYSHSVLAAFYDAVPLVSVEDAPRGVATLPLEGDPGAPQRGIVKGPSFGAVFTIMTPFVYLAHYDAVRTREGRRQLYGAGLNPYLLRLSVGTEPPAALIAALTAGFDAAAATATR